MARPIAGEFARFALQQLREFQNLRRLLHPSLNVGFWQLGNLQAVGHVVVHAHVRVQRVVLKHHGDVALRRFEVVDDAPADVNLAAGDFLQARHHAQQRALAAAARPDDDDELAVADLGVDAVDDLVDLGAGAVGLFDIAQ
jgi:hypothetical protein